MQPRSRRVLTPWHHVWFALCLSLILELLHPMMTIMPRMTEFVQAQPTEGGTKSNNTGPPAFVKIGALFQLTGAGANGTSPRYQQDHPLPLTSYSGVYTDLSMGFAAFKFQLNQLNSDASLLPQTQLTYEHYDDQGTPQGGFFGALHLVQNGASVLIGAATSLTSASAEIVANNFDIPIVSYASTSPVLSEKRTYPTFLRVCHSEALTATAMVYTMKNQFGWDNIAILYQDSVYGNTADYFIKTASSLNMTVTVSVPFRFGSTEDDFIAPMTRLRESGSQIFVFLGLPLDWRAAVKAGKVVGNIFTNDTAWMVDDAMTLNLPDDLLYMAPGLLSITPARDDSSSEYQDWVTSFLNRPVSPDENPIETFTATKDQLSFYIAFIADALTAVAHALHDLIEVRQKYDFTPHDIQLAIASSNFTGISGQVSFDSNYDRMGVTFQLKNLQGNKWKVIATWDPSDPANLAFVPNAPPILFFDGTSNVPGVNHIIGGLDGDVRTSLANSDPVFYSFIIIPVIMIVLLLLTAAIIYFCRNTRVIHVASPLMLELIVLGAILVSLSVLISAFPQSVARCSAKPFFFHIGFQFSIGSMMLKSYRLHRIFNNKELTTARFNRFYPVWFVILGVLLDATILTIRSALNPYKLEVVSQCTLEKRWSGGNYDKFVSVLTAFLLFEKIFIILWGVWLSYKVRNLPTLYNESSYLAYATWNLLLLYSTYLGVKYGVDISNPEAQLTFENVLLITSVLSTCGLIFVPKVIDLYASEKHRFFFYRLREQAKKGAAFDRQLSIVPNASRKDAAGNPRNALERLHANGPHAVVDEDEYQLKSDSDEESLAQRRDPKSMKDIMSILQLIQEHNVRHLDRAIGEMQQLKSATRDKKKEIASTNETLFQIRTEQLYYQSVAKSVGDAQVVELFLERMNEFAMMSSVSRESQIVSSEGNPERGALSRGIVEPRVGGSLPMLHPPEPARGRRARLAAQGPGSTSQALAMQRKLYRDVKGAMLHDPIGYPSSVAPPYPTPQHSLVRQSSAPQPLHSRRSASREKMRQSQLQQQHQQQMMHLYQTNELMQPENRSQLLSEVPVEERSAEEDGEEMVAVRIDTVPTETTTASETSEQQKEPPPMLLDSLKRNVSSSNPGSQANSPRSVKMPLDSNDATETAATVAMTPRLPLSKETTPPTTTREVDEAAIVTEASSPSSAARTIVAQSHAAEDNQRSHSHLRVIRVHVSNGHEPDLRATPPFSTESPHELAAPFPAPADPSPHGAPATAADTPAQSSSVEAASSRSHSLSSAKDDHPTFDALDTIP